MLFRSGFCSYSLVVEACDLHLEELNDIHIVFDHDYSNKSDIGRTQAEIFKVRKSVGSCSFFVTFSGQEHRQVQNLNGQQLNYDLFNSVQHDNSLRDLPEASLPNVLGGKFNIKQSTKTLQYYFFAPYNQNASAGVYRDKVNVSVYEGDLNNFILRNSHQVTYTVTVPPKIDISIQTMGLGVLDFGTLQAGESRSFAVDILANVPYDLSMESENKGMLKHSSSHQVNTIPYILQHDGQVVDLSDMARFSFVQKKLLLDHNMHDFTVTIGNFDFVSSGEYQDNIIFTVTAR